MFKSILDKITCFIFEKIPVLRTLDGYKRLIGNLLLVFALVLAAAHSAVAQYFPGVDFPLLDQLIAYVGIAVRLLGDIHADAKNRS